MLEAHLQVLSEIGVIEAPEGGIFRLNAGDIELRFTSPLVQGQAARDVERFVQGVQIVQQVAGPQSVELLGLSAKIEEVTDWVFKKLNVDPELLRTAAEKEALQQMAGQAAAAQQGAPMAQGGQDMAAQSEMEGAVV